MKTRIAGKEAARAIRNYETNGEGAAGAQARGPLTKYQVRGGGEGGKGEGVQTGGDESLGVRRTVRTSMGDPHIVRGLIEGGKRMAVAKACQQRARR
jgi:hypothetical protein